MATGKYSDLIYCNAGRGCTYSTNSVKAMAGHVKHAHSKKVTIKDVDELKGHLNLKQRNRGRR